MKKEIVNHLNHIEDLIFLEGDLGLRKVKDYFKNISKNKITLKWDGSPSCFIGKDPSDGNFFVATKSIFNKDPVCFKSKEEIENKLSGDLRDKLLKLFLIFKDENITNIIQGDLLYDKEDLKQEIIDGKQYITFHPNTIAYAVPKEDELARKTSSSDLGVAWHTVYRGHDLRTMQTDLNSKIEINSEKVMSFDVNVKSDFIEINDNLNDIDLMFLSKILENKEFRTILKQYLNVLIKKKISNNFVDELIFYISEFYEKEKQKRKTIDSFNKINERENDLISFIKENKDNFDLAFIEYNKIANIKKSIIDQLNKNNNIKTFLLKTNLKYEKTSHEGYVLTNEKGENIKLVNREIFSYANFSEDIIKGWH